jgi:hypothetical protein
MSNRISAKEADAITELPLSGVPERSKSVHTLQTMRDQRPGTSGMITRLAITASCRKPDASIRSAR